MNTARILHRQDPFNYLGRMKAYAREQLRLARIFRRLGARHYAVTHWEAACLALRNGLRFQRGEYRPWEQENESRLNRR